MGPLIYRKIPLFVEAMQLRIDTAEKILEWLTQHNTQYMLDYDIFQHPVIRIPGQEGIDVLMEHDWLIRGYGGEFYKCSPQRFRHEYIIEKREDSESSTD